MCLENQLFAQMQETAWAWSSFETCRVSGARLQVLRLGQRHPNALPVDDHDLAAPLLCVDGGAVRGDAPLAQRGTPRSILCRLLKQTMRGMNAVSHMRDISVRVHAGERFLRACDLHRLRPMIRPQVFRQHMPARNSTAMPR